MERAERRSGRRVRAWAAAAVAGALAASYVLASPAGAIPEEPPQEELADHGSYAEAIVEEGSGDDSFAAAATPGLTLPPLVIGGVPSATAGGSGAAGAPANAAGADRPARRLRQLGSIPFPIEPQPRCEVTDSFGDPRSGGRSHEGVDIIAGLGQPVYAVADGTLTKKYVDGVDSSISGNGWKLSMSDRSFFFYAHMSGFAQGLEVGSKVQRGDLIGFVGDSGNSGPGNHHLHFEYHPLGGAAIDTFPLLEIPSTCRVY